MQQRKRRRQNDENPTKRHQDKCTVVQSLIRKSTYIQYTCTVANIDSIGRMITPPGHRNIINKVLFEMSIQPLSPSRENMHALFVHPSALNWVSAIALRLWQTLKKTKKKKQDQSRQHGSRKPESEQFWIEWTPWIQFNNSSVWSGVIERDFRVETAGLKPTDADEMNLIMLSLTFRKKRGRDGHTFPLQPERTVRINQNIRPNARWRSVRYTRYIYMQSKDTMQKGRNTSQ